LTNKLTFGKSDISTTFKDTDSRSQIVMDAFMDNFRLGQCDRFGQFDCRIRNYPIGQNS